MEALYFDGYQSMQQMDVPIQKVCAHVSAIGIYCAPVGVPTNWHPNQLQKYQT